MFYLSNIAWSATYYVSPSGSDANPGTIYKPFRSLSFVANKKVKPGDTVIALDGTYYDTDQGKNEAILYIRKGGTSEKRIVFKALNPGKAVLDGRNIVKYGICCPASYVDIEGFAISKCREWGISVYGSRIDIYRNTIYDNANNCPADFPYGVGGIFASSSASYITIDSNRIYHNGRLYLQIGKHKNDNQDHGIYLCSKHSEIVNNLIHDNQAYGIQIASYNDVNNVIISNNTIFGEQNRGGIVLWRESTMNCIVQNNIVINNKGFAIKFLDDGGHHIIRNNIFFNNSSGIFNTYSSPGNSILGNMITDPMLNDSFVPKDGSPAINNGYIANAPNHDIEGKLRNAIDIGCFEYEKDESSLNPPSNIHILSISY